MRRIATGRMDAALGGEMAKASKTHGWVSSFLAIGFSFSLVPVAALAMSKESVKQLNEAQLRAMAEMQQTAKEFLTSRASLVSIGEGDGGDVELPKDAVKEAACGRGDSCTDVANKD
jgi:hypothetical protein